MKRSLQLTFDQPTDFLREWETNLSVGGAVVPSGDTWEVRELVSLELSFSFMDGRETFDAEVVFADPSGKVMVQLNVPAMEVRGRIEPLVEAAKQQSAGGGAAPAPAPSAPLPEPILETEPLDAFDISSSADEPALDFSLEASDDPFDRSAVDLGEAEDSELAGLDLDSIDIESLSSEPELESDAFDAAALDAASEAPLEDAGAVSDPGEFLAEDLETGIEEDSGALLGDDSPQAFAEMRDLDAFEGEELAHGFDGQELEAEAYETGEFEVLSDAGDSVSEEGQASEPDIEIVSGDDFTDRRGAIREQARVPVRVDANNVSFEGRTRDLSDTGVLISVDGSELPVGKQVMISLTHPDTGEAIEVPGTVKRHIDTEGTVAAVGVEIEGSEGEMRRFESLVQNIQQVEHERRASGISGVIEELGMPNLLQMLAQSSPQGTLTVTNGTEEGVIAFEGGVLRYSRLGTLGGSKAFGRMLGWESGHFQFVGQVDPLPNEDPPVSLEAALLDAIRLRDEEAREPRAEIEPSVVLSVDMEALARDGANLDKTQEAVVDLAAAGFTVRRVLDIIPESDGTILRSIEELRELGIVKL